VTSGLLRVLLVACGSLCVALGVLGIFLPLMPTTVFLLLAAACYARSSDRFYRRLLGHRLLGSYIRNSREGRGMRRRDKIVTLAMLWAGIGASIVWSTESPWLRFVLIGIATAVTVHVARIRAFEPLPDAQDERAPSR
jgi:uncharacterized membrane protein YbaN (DUF454 family)